MLLDRISLSRLLLPCVAAVAVAGVSRAQAGSPTYSHIVIVDAVYSDAGSTFTLDTNADGMGDTTVTDPGNKFFKPMWDEYTWQGFMTHIWVNGDGVIIDLEQWYLD